MHTLPTVPPRSFSAPREKSPAATLQERTEIQMRLNETDIGKLPSGFIPGSCSTRSEEAAHESAHSSEASMLCKDTGLRSVCRRFGQGLGESRREGPRPTADVSQRNKGAMCSVCRRRIDSKDHRQPLADTRTHKQNTKKKNKNKHKQTHAERLTTGLHKSPTGVCCLTAFVVPEPSMTLACCIIVTGDTMVHCKGCWCCRQVHPRSELACVHDDAVQNGQLRTPTRYSTMQRETATYGIRVTLSV